METFPKVQFMGQLDGVAMKKDRTMSIKIGTQELPATEMSYIMDMANKIVWVAMAETPHQEIEIPEILPEFKGDKTPSQRMRAVIFRIWETTDRSTAFPVFYETKVLQIVEWLKEKYLT